MSIKRGTVREDGMIFVRYQKRKHCVSEYWVSVEKHAKIMALARARAAKSLANKDANWHLLRKERDKARHSARVRTRKKEPRDLANSRRKRWVDTGGPVVKLSLTSRTHIARGLRLVGSKKSMRSCSYIGCSWADLSVHLEGLFEPGMTWDNYGYRGWHVDHIVPLSSAGSLEELLPLLHFSNLRPMWGVDNMRKGSSL